MYAGGPFDGGAALFSGGGFMPSQATQTPESSFSKSRGTQALLPLTVKQICESCLSNDENSNFLVDGVEANNVKLLGRVTNMAERVTEVSFTLDDGTGRVEAKRWVNEASDSNEMTAIQNGMYVSINGSLKGFLGKKHVVAFSVSKLQIVVTEFSNTTSGNSAFVVTTIPKSLAQFFLHYQPTVIEVRHAALMLSHLYLIRKDLNNPFLGKNPPVSLPA